MKISRAKVFIVFFFFLEDLVEVFCADFRAQEMKKYFLKHVICFFVPPPKEAAANNTAHGNRLRSQNPIKRVNHFETYMSIHHLSIRDTEPCLPHKCRLQYRRHGAAVITARCPVEQKGPQIDRYTGRPCRLCCMWRHPSMRRPEDHTANESTLFLAKFEKRDLL